MLLFSISRKNVYLIQNQSQMKAAPVGDATGDSSTIADDLCLMGFLLSSVKSSLTLM